MTLPKPKPKPKPVTFKNNTGVFQKKQPGIKALIRNLQQPGARGQSKGR